MKYIVLVLLLIFSGIFLFSQTVYYGLPTDSVSSGSIIITDDIEWETSFVCFSPKGKKQVSDICSFLTKVEAFDIEIKIHSFYSSDDKVNLKICKVIAKHMQEQLEKEHCCFKRIHFVLMGSEEPLIKKNIERNLFLQYNNRIEIRIK